MTFTYLIFYFNISYLFLYNFKLSILSNHAEHPKKLAPFVKCITFFYNSKIFILNGLGSPFREDDFN